MHEKTIADIRAQIKKTTENTLLEENDKLRSGLVVFAVSLVIVLIELQKCT